MADFKMAELDVTLNTLDPLRYLRLPPDSPVRNPLILIDTDLPGSDLDVIPAQPPSVAKEVIEMSFPPLKYPIKLSVDPSPGCGGVAWPAGEVRHPILCP